MNHSFNPSDPARFATAVRSFDEENAKDPNSELLDGKPEPRELVYSRWLSDWVLRLQPDASEALRLAACAAHLRRWAIPRGSYPATRAGYLQWRGDLKKFHADSAAEILREIGYPEDTIQKVELLISKRAFPQEPESRTLEDALCLVFLEHQFSDLAKRCTEEQILSAVQKTWKKMTPAAQQIALRLNYRPEEAAVLQRALSAAQPKAEKSKPGSAEPGSV